MKGERTTMGLHTPEAIVDAGGRQLLTGDYQSLHAQLECNAGDMVIVMLTRDIPENQLVIIRNEEAWMRERSSDQDVIGFFAFPVGRMHLIPAAPAREPALS
ncbi:hypothetical protein HYZ99_00325 [Candidatus Peregrinibacteria bacterium]|nr:hypothetical protein [Candidatus Peregrinibacteria bacterium]